VSDQFQSISVWRDRVSYACSIVIMSLNYTNTCTYRVNQDEPSPKAIMTYEDTYILPLLSSLKQLCLQTIIDYQLPIDRLPVTMQTLITSFQVTTTDDSVRTEVTE
jgi:hypothetical protein